MKAIQQSDQDWVTREWFPRVIAAGLKRMALVMAKSGVAQMNVEAITGKIPGDKLVIQYFGTVEAAKAWLAVSPTPTPRGLPAKLIS
jgi:hypothetical protein